MAKSPATSRSSSTSSASQSSSPSGGPGFTAKATATDKMEAEVIRGTPVEPGQPHPLDGQEITTHEPQVPEGEKPPRGAQTHLGASLGDISTPETAISTLKEKVALLHTTINNTAHYSTLKFSDVEQLVADIRWIVIYIQSKV